MELKSNEPDNLPLVVWLKGNESYFDHFNMDADEVMRRLGIKRSRLRQISGQELRVGRKRVDRYVRPVYRPEDVESYLNWTRATISHKKSTGLLQQAVDDLSGLGHEIQEKFSGDILTALRQINEGINLLGRHSSLLHKESLRSLCQRTETLTKTVSGALQNLESNQRHICSILDTLREQLKQLTESQELGLSTLLTCGQNGESTLNLALESKKMGALLSESLQGLEHQLTLQKELTEEGLLLQRQTRAGAGRSSVGARALLRRGRKPGWQKSRPPEGGRRVLGKSRHLRKTLTERT